MHTHMSSSYRCRPTVPRDCWFRFSLGYFVCFACFYLGQFVYLMVTFCVFGVFSLVCFELSVRYQCKRLPGKTRPRSDLLCVERDVKLYSLTHILRWYTCPQMVTHPSINMAAHSCKSNFQPVDHKSDALTITVPSQPFVESSKVKIAQTHTHLSTKPCSCSTMLPVLILLTA